MTEEKLQKKRRKKKYKVNFYKQSFIIAMEFKE